MKQSLDELIQYLRQTVPQSKTITQLRPNEEAGVVTFHWQGREFLVKKSLEVMETKGKSLYLTGASMLLQSVLMRRNYNEKALEGTLPILSQIEEMVLDQRRTEAGLKLLESVKETLARLLGKKLNRLGRSQPTRMA
jgi:hypothetical protein